MQMTSLKRNTHISEKVKYDWNKMKPKDLKYAKIWLSKYKNQKYGSFSQQNKKTGKTTKIRIKIRRNRALITGKTICL